MQVLAKGQAEPIIKKPITKDLEEEKQADEEPLDFDKHIDSNDSEDDMI